MAEQDKGTNIIGAYDKATDQINKLQFLQAILAEGGDPLDYEGAKAGMYYILEDMKEALTASIDTLYEAALNGEAKEQKEAEDSEVRSK